MSCTVHAINDQRKSNGTRAPGPVGAVESCQRGKEQTSGWREKVLEEVEQEQVAVGQLIGRTHQNWAHRFVTNFDLKCRAACIMNVAEFFDCICELFYCYCYCCRISLAKAVDSVVAHPGLISLSSIMSHWWQ